MTPTRRDEAIALTDLLRRNVDLLSRGEPEGSPIMIELDAARVEVNERATPSAGCCHPRAYRSREAKATGSGFLSPVVGRADHLQKLHVGRPVE